MKETLQDWRDRVGYMSGELELKEPLKSYQQWLNENPQGVQLR